MQTASRFVWAGRSVLCKAAVAALFLETSSPWAGSSRTVRTAWQHYNNVHKFELFPFAVHKIERKANNHVLLKKNINNIGLCMWTLLHLLIIGVFSIVVAITSLVLVVYAVTGLVEVCVEIVKPWHLSVWKKSRKAQVNQHLYCGGPNGLIEVMVNTANNVL